MTMRLWRQPIGKSPARLARSQAVLTLSFSLSLGPWTGSGSSTPRVLAAWPMSWPPPMPLA
eukprot:10147997-Alexandrium_andersonii.AAC.1